MAVSTSKNGAVEAGIRIIGSCAYVKWVGEKDPTREGVLLNETEFLLWKPIIPGFTPMSSQKNTKDQQAGQGQQEENHENLQEDQTPADD